MLSDERYRSELWGSFDGFFNLDEAAFGAEGERVQTGTTQIDSVECTGFVIKLDFGGDTHGIAYKRHLSFMLHILGFRSNFSEHVFEKTRIAFDRASPDCHR